MTDQMTSLIVRRAWKRFCFVRSPVVGKLETRSDRRKHRIETLGEDNWYRVVVYSTSKSTSLDWRAEIYIARVPSSPPVSLSPRSARPWTRNAFKNHLYKRSRSTIPIVHFSRSFSKMYGRKRSFVRSTFAFRFWWLHTQCTPNVLKTYMYMYPCWEHFC